MREGGRGGLGPAGTQASRAIETFGEQDASGVPCVLIISSYYVRCLVSRISHPPLVGLVLNGSQGGEVRVELFTGPRLSEVVHHCSAAPIGDIFMDSLQFVLLFSNQCVSCVFSIQKLASYARRHKNTFIQYVFLF